MIASEDNSSTVAAFVQLQKHVHIVIILGNSFNAFFSRINCDLIHWIYVGLNFISLLCIALNRFWQLCWGSESIRTQWCACICVAAVMAVSSSQRRFVWQKRGTKYLFPFYYDNCFHQVKKWEESSSPSKKNATLCCYRRSQFSLSWLVVSLLLLRLYFLCHA